MISEDLKHLNGLLVTVVRPFFGGQSDSFMGEFEWIKLVGVYQLILNDHSMIFKLEDVSSVDFTPSVYSSPHSAATIRLKGPEDYINISDWGERD